ncbi:MAG: SpoIIE family protein phosphatase [Clostridiales bacterium]|nr:SpoIIE family protein phosphatase [Clostridiales bacterium]
MKRFRNLVIGGIEHKLFNLILITVAAVTAVFILMTLYQTNMLAGLAADTSRRQRESIGKITDSVMDLVIEDNMTRITQLQADNTDNMFLGIKIRVQMIGDYLWNLYSDPDSVIRMPYDRPNKDLDGELSVQLLTAKGVDASDPALADKLGIAANASDMMISICSAYDTDNIYIALPEGAVLSTNTVAGSWVNEDGSYVSFDPRTRYWYKKAVETGSICFTDAEYDEATQKLCVTCAMPVKNSEGEILAVVGADLFLDDMQQALLEYNVGDGFLAVINQDGHVILSPKEEGVFQVRDSSQAIDLRQAKNTAVASLVRDAMQGKTNIREITSGGEYYYAAGAPMQTVGWTVIAVFSADAAARPTLMLQESYNNIESEATSAYRSGIKRTRTTMIILLAVLIVALCAASLIQGKKIVTPLNTIIKRISELKEGNLEFQMEGEYRTGDEIEVLAESFASISHKTVEYVEQVKRATAEKERIGTELETASLIQSSILPHVFPAFPDRGEFDIYASMDPAKAVGGDFYDFFLIDDDHLCMVIADVSGKGIPAALFMMVTKVILKNCAMLGQSPAEALKNTNETICSNNQADMFVTVWMGILEISTGKVTAANAGHEYPAFMRSNGGFELFKDKHGFIIGGMAGMKYKQYELQLDPGDKLFVYTDGVPEATDAANELFGTERMLMALNGNVGSSPQQLLMEVRKAVDFFVKDAEQFDDLTMLCMEYKGK